MADGDRYARQVGLFGEEGQRRLHECRVALVGAGGLGSHVAQQLAHLGVGRVAVLDHDVLDDTNRNRLIGARDGDPDGTPKVQIAERLISETNDSVEVVSVQAQIMTDEGRSTLQGTTHVFGCVDKEGVRLQLVELCAERGLPYIDLATEIHTEGGLEYGGRVFVSKDGDGCLVCCDVLDREEVARDLAPEVAREAHRKIYGVDLRDMGGASPAVVSINGIIASFGVTEFLVMVTGLRAPHRHLRYRGSVLDRSPLTVVRDAPPPDCYYCSRA